MIRAIVLKISDELRFEFFNSAEQHVDLLTLILRRLCRLLPWWSQVSSILVILSHLIQETTPILEAVLLRIMQQSQSHQVKLGETSRGQAEQIDDSDLIRELFLQDVINKSVDLVLNSL